MDRKKMWSKPKLVVFARSNPEETVLKACKGDGSNKPRTDPKTGHKCVATGGTCSASFRT